MATIILADLKGRRGYVNKDTVAGGYGSRFRGDSFVTRLEKNVRRVFQNVPSIQSRHPGRTVWGRAATAMMTGIPASIAAQKIARREVSRTGVLAPEACFEPQSFFAELAHRGIVIEQR